MQNYNIFTSFSPQKIRQFSREIKVEFLDKKWRFRTVWELWDSSFSLKTVHLLCLQSWLTYFPQILTDEQGSSRLSFISGMSQSQAASSSILQNSGKITFWIEMQQCQDGGLRAELLIKSAHSNSMRLGTCQLRKRVRFMIQKSSNKKSPQASLESSVGWKWMGTLAHCSKSSFFVQKFNFDFPWKLSIFLGGEKLVKMLWFWAF